MKVTLIRLFSPFILPLTMLIGVGIFGAYVNTQLYRSVRSLEHINEVFYSAQSILSYLKDTETGVRGYLYTRDTDFLTPYYTGLKNLGPAFDTLENLVRDEPEQGKRVRSLRYLADNRIRLLDSIIVLIGQPEDSARHQIVRNMTVGKIWMDEARKMTAEICDSEKAPQTRLEAQKSLQTVQGRIVVCVIIIIGAVMFAYAVGRMIKEVRRRVHYERRLEHTVTLLEENNREMESFSFALAHNLQEPLRKMTTFIDLLNSRYANNLDQEGLRLTGKIQQFSIDLRQMIEGMLEVANTSHYKNSDFSSRIPVRHVLDKTQALLADQIRARHAVITLEEPLPEVPGNLQQLVLLFSHLLENSLKFAKPGQAPQITIRSALISGDDVPMAHFTQHQLSFCRIEFSDNGLGIEEEYKAKIFGLFQKVHQNKGAGIGLAIAKKVMLNHRGFIDVNSVAGEGTTFLLYFPL